MSLNKFTYIFLFLILINNAHLDAGEDRVVDGYYIDFGYTPKNLNAYESSIFVFNLANNSSKEVIDPNNVWIRISKDEKVLFSADLASKSKSVSFSYVFF